MATNGKSSKPAKSKNSKPAASKPAVSKPPAAKPAAAKSAKPTKAKAAAAKPGPRGKDSSAAGAPFHVHVDRLAVLIASGNAEPGSAAETFPTFAAAKERAMERLIEVIERAERRLHALRHAASCADYERSHVD